MPQNVTLYLISVAVEIFPFFQFLWFNFFSLGYNFLFFLFFLFCTEFFNSVIRPCGNVLI